MFFHRKDIKSTQCCHRFRRARVTTKVLKNTMNNMQKKTTDQKLGCFLVCDYNLSVPASALAKRLATMWNIDVHIFVELSDSISEAVEEVTDERVTYHYDELYLNQMDILPNHPRFSRAAWGRLFAPNLLAQYRRLLYVDVDILPGPLQCDLSQVHLPYGIAMVRDAGRLDFKQAINTSRCNNGFAASPLVGKYFNSGVILFDPSNWDHLYLCENLEKYCEEGRVHSQYPDQDFINAVFAGKIMELSPNLNYQFPFMNLGLIASGRPTIRHFNSTSKPFHLSGSYGTPEPIVRVLDEYRQMLNEAKLTVFPVKNPNSPDLFRQMKGKFRYLLDRFGVVTTKKRNLDEIWSNMRCDALNYIREGFENDIFLDNANLVWQYETPATYFNGFEILTD